MSTAPLTTAEPRVRSGQTAQRAKVGVVVALLLSIGGLFAISSACMALWTMWTDDPLKSIGGLMPLVSLVLILRVWRSLGWEMDGSAWGLVILTITIGVVHWRDQAVLEPGAPGLRRAGARDQRTPWLAVAIGVAALLLGLAGARLERRRPRVIL